MHEEHLVCKVRQHKYNSYKGRIGKIAPNLLNRDFSTTKSNEKRVTDVTQFKLFGTKLYLPPILDLHNQSLISWNLSEMENFFELLKSELLYLQEFESVEHFKKELIKYLHWYNKKRIKVKLKGLTTLQVRNQSLKLA